MTADDVIWTFTRLMDGSKAYPGARYVRIIKGAVEVEKGQAQDDLGPAEDRRCHARDDADREGRSGLLLHDRHDLDLPGRRGRRRTRFATKPIGLGPFKFVEYVPGSRLVGERWEKFYKPGKPYADRVMISIMGEAAARDVAFRNKEIDASILGPAQYVAYQADPEPLQGAPRGRRGLHPRTWA